MKDLIVAIWIISFLIFIVLRVFEAVSILPVILDVIIGIIIAIKAC